MLRTRKCMNMKRMCATSVYATIRMIAAKIEKKKEETQESILASELSCWSRMMVLMDDCDKYFILLFVDSKSVALQRILNELKFISAPMPLPNVRTKFIKITHEILQQTNEAHL